jgi:hypothetical protein
MREQGPAVAATAAAVEADLRSKSWAGCEEWMRFGIGGERGADSVERWVGFAALAPATLVGCQTVVLPRLVRLASGSRASSNSLVIVTSKISCSAH